MDILSNSNLINYINYVKSLTPNDRRMILSSNPNWTINLILTDYYSDEIILGDGELLKLIESHRVGNISKKGTSEMDPYEILYLMKAWKSQQYHRFMCHILFRYMNKNNLNKVKPVLLTNDKKDKLECGICWRDLNGVRKPNEINEDTAFTSEGTGTILCSNCLGQLMRFSQLMTLLNDEEFNKLMK